MANRKPRRGAARSAAMTMNDDADLAERVEQTAELFEQFCFENGIVMLGVDKRVREADGSALLGFSQRPTW